MAFTQTKTPIVYYGGKTSILNYLLEMVPPHEVYTETFFGGGTLFWAKDPPYPNADQGHYSGYGWDEYEKLLQWCATECKGKFLLSSYNSVMLDGYTKIYEWHKKEITRFIGGKKDINTRLNRKGIVTEVLISNYATPCGTLSLFN